MNTLRHVMIIDYLHGYYARMLLRGISLYNQEHEPWSLHATSLQPDPDELIRRIRPDGIIAHLPQRFGHLAETARELGIPVVAVVERTDDALPLTGVDDLAVGRTAAEYFIEAGYRAFAYVGKEGVGYSVRREKGYREALRRSGFECSCFFMPKDSYAALEIGHIESGIAVWLKSLPAQTALFACNDYFAYQVLLSCRQEGIAVPEHLAVLGTDDDDMIWPICNPWLSSIRLPFDRAGYYAAERMDALLAGKEVDPAPLLLQPSGVVTRRSSDLVAVQDPLVKRALLLIRQNLSHPFMVSDLLEQLLISRTLLERRFKEVLGRTPLAEIHRQKIDFARRLLADTAMSVDMISEKCGISSSMRLATLFKRVTGVSPSQYRRTIRNPQSHLTGRS